MAELDGPDVALATVERLEDDLVSYHAYHATRADLLRRLGRTPQSRAAYDKAIALAGNTAETAALSRRRDGASVMTETRYCISAHLPMVAPPAMMTFSSRAFA